MLSSILEFSKLKLNYGPHQKFNFAHIHNVIEMYLHKVI